MPVCYFCLMTDLKNPIRQFEKTKPKLKISDCLTQHSRGMVYRPIFHGEQTFSGENLASAH